MVAYQSFSIRSFGPCGPPHGPNGRKEPTGTPALLGSEPESEAIAGSGHTTAIIVKSDGAVAWIVGSGAKEGHHQVHAADTTGSRLLSKRSDVDPTSPALIGARSTGRRTARRSQRR
jgi:hypothetical protein